MPDSFKDLLKDPMAAKMIGALVGVMISMAMIAPDGTKNALYRSVLGTIAGFIFAPVMADQFWFLKGHSWEDWLAASAFTGFTVWFVLEAIARFLKSDQTMDGLIEFLKSRGGKP